MDHESISAPSPNCAAAMGSQQSLDLPAQNLAKLLEKFIDLLSPGDSVIARCHTSPSYLLHLPERDSL